ncbi:galactose-binding like protein [Pyrrhoderma noxium]|uniref:Galactose-binding like protein n=1 Tax=Pyrrhoderma noxium TaxID=2282107 RepID=A0A286UTB3_9AGAM|nr:galactose-binding like protein [Pyrrhoderma noxium]
MSGTSNASLINAETKIRVSSTLDKSVGKKYLTDGNPETCWTSQQGLPQYIHIKFNSPVVPKKIHITFQGGFVGKTCSLSVIEVVDEKSTDQKSLKTISTTGYKVHATN